MKSFKFDELDKPERYFFMTSVIVPRPIAVVSTINESGADNLAPFSYFNAVSSDPPCIMISFSRKRDRGLADTLTNILKNKEFVVHIAHDSQIDIVESTGHSLPYGESEREKLGLTVTKSTWLKHCPRVNEFPVAMECTLEKTIEIGDNTVVFGRILGAHVNENILIAGEKKADPFKLLPLARMAREYSGIRVMDPAKNLLKS